MCPDAQILTKWRRAPPAAVEAGTLVGGMFLEAGMIQIRQMAHTHSNSYYFFTHRADVRTHGVCRVVCPLIWSGRVGAVLIGARHGLLRLGSA
jgi:hypothetical protein